MEQYSARCRIRPNNKSVNFFLGCQHGFLRSITAPGRNCNGPPLELRAFQQQPFRSRACVLLAGFFLGVPGGGHGAIAVTFDLMPHHLNIEAIPILDILSSVILTDSAVPSAT